MDHKEFEKCLNEMYYLGYRHGAEMQKASPALAEKKLAEIIAENKDGKQRDKTN